MHALAMGLAMRMATRWLPADLFIIANAAGHLVASPEFHDLLVSFGVNQMYVDGFASALALWRTMSIMQKRNQAIIVESKV